MRAELVFWNMVEGIVTADIHGNCIRHDPLHHAAGKVRHARSADADFFDDLARLVGGEITHDPVAVLGDNRIEHGTVGSL
jgi:hypothetical protein